MTLTALGPLDIHVVAFCRAGACIMLVPVYSSLHIPARARLYFALAISVSIAPFITLPSEAGRAAALGSLPAIIALECLTGATLGLAARLIFSAMQLAGGIMALSSGYSGPGAADDGSGEPQPELGALVSATVLVLMVALDMHVEIIRILIDSFDSVPVGAAVDPGSALDNLVGAATQSLGLAMRVAAPFMIAGFIVNTAFGMVNKIAPQIPAYFISTPFLLMVAVWLLQRVAVDVTSDSSRRMMSLFGGG